MGFAVVAAFVFCGKAQRRQEGHAVGIAEVAEGILRDEYLALGLAIPLALAFVYRCPRR
jgi:hypothetical protein